MLGVQHSIWCYNKPQKCLFGRQTPSHFEKRGWELPHLWYSVERITHCKLIFTLASRALPGLLGLTWRVKLIFSVTDGARNMTGLLRRAVSPRALGSLPAWIVSNLVCQSSAASWRSGSNVYCNKRFLSHSFYLFNFVFSATENSALWNALYVSKFSLKDDGSFWLWLPICLLDIGGK